jgi:hypothetical protein
MRPEQEVRSASPAETTRPRYARICAAVAAVLVTVVAVLGGLGVLPGAQATARPSAQRVTHGSLTVGSTPAADSSTQPTSEPSGGQPDGAMALSGGRSQPRPGVEESLAVPSASGSGRRIVFDMSRQRVWLVGQRAARDVVRRTYLVSGSVTDNLQPGTYHVYSKSARAWGVDDSGTMRYMVRFTRGARAAIGFHDIPVDNGELVQTRAQLGTPLSHGCIRQWRPDAQALWRFAPLHTKVVVLA